MSLEVVKEGSLIGVYIRSVLYSTLGQPEVSQLQSWVEGGDTVAHDVTVGCLREDLSHGFPALVTFVLQ